MMMMFSVVDFVVVPLNWNQKPPCQGRVPGAEKEKLYSLLMQVMPLCLGVGLVWELQPQGEGGLYQCHLLLWKIDKQILSFNLEALKFLP